MDLQQHFLNLQDDKLENIILNTIQHIDFNNIIELGAGKGDFTKTFMKCNHPIIAYELDSSLKNEFLEKSINTTFVVKDICDNIDMNIQDLIISAPPYNLLDFINEEYIKKFNMRYILMVSQRQLKLFEGSRTIYTLSGDDFTPVSNGEHYIITNI